MTFRFKSITLNIVGAALFALLAFSSVHAQKLSSLDRGRAKSMLNNIKGEIKNNYFDPKFKGVDIDAVFDAANEKLETATSLGQAFGIIAQAVLELDDSHTTFYPPSVNIKVEYGWRMQMIGDKCFVVAVKPKSDAEKKGLKVGDQIVKIEGFAPNRKDLWKINYYYNVINPRGGLNLVVKSPGTDATKELGIASKQVRTKPVASIDEYIREFELSSDRPVENRFVKVGNTFAWHMPTFAQEPGLIDGIMNGRASQAPNLIIDLRGNGGGYVATLETLAGYFVEKDTKIADYKARKPYKPQMAKSKGNGIYRGRLVVLIDSHSGSASELFARFIQIHERGVVMGDRSAGAVMMSRGASMQHGTEQVVLYGMNLTHADVIMTDGNSLEHVGVTPNVRLVPSSLSLSQGHDPVLAEAFRLLGENVTPEQAGKFFPFNWKNEE
jgi:carboxyl-terminal processing protease